MAAIPSFDESVEGENGFDDANQVSPRVQWVRFKVVMSSDAFETVARAREILESMGVSHDVEAIAWGKVLEMLAADFLASGWVDRGDDVT